jgi:hypothetical protein
MSNKNGGKGLFENWVAEEAARIGRIRQATLRRDEAKTWCDLMNPSATAVQISYSH